MIADGRLKCVFVDIHHGSPLPLQAFVKHDQYVPVFAVLTLSRDTGSQAIHSCRVH